MTGPFIDHTRDTECVFCPSKRFKLYYFFQFEFSYDFYFARECIDCGQKLVITKEDCAYLQKLRNIKEDEIPIRV